MAQNGEEPIIQDLLAKLPGIPKTCLEVGAADGVWFSNTYELWKNQGYSAILIEADDGGYDRLKKNTEGLYPRVVAVHSRIEPTGKNSLDKIITDNGMNDLGLLSLDIDGYDYQIFEAMKIRPWIAIIEFNATFPPGCDIVSDRPFMGCSATALARLAANKGYLVVNLIGSNMFLLRADVLPEELDGDDLDLHELNQQFVRSNFPTHSITYLVTDYAGNWAMYGPAVFGMCGRMPNPPKGLS